MEVFVQDAAGQRFPVVLNEHDTVLDVKKLALKAMDGSGDMVLERVALKYEGEYVDEEDTTVSFNSLTGIEPDHDILITYNDPLVLRASYMSGKLGLDDYKEGSVEAADPEIAKHLLSKYKNTEASVKTVMDCTSPSVKNDKEFVLAVVEKNSYAFQHIPEELMQDTVFMISIIRRWPELYNHLYHCISPLSEHVRKTLYPVYRACSGNLALSDPDICDNKDLVLIQIERWNELFTDARQMGALKNLALSFVSDRLKNDKEVVLAAVVLNPENLQHASPAMRNDKEVVLKALIAKPLKLSSKDLRNDREVVLAAVRKSGTCLQFASVALRNDVEVVGTALRNTVEALPHASSELMGDKRLVSRFGEALQFAPESFRTDREVVLGAVGTCGLALQFASSALQGDKKVVTLAVENDGLALQFASEELRKDRSVVLSAVKNNGLALQFASEELRKDHSVVLSAVKNNGLALQFASEELRKDRSVVLSAVQNDGLALQFASEELWKDRSVVLSAVQNDGLALQFASALQAPEVSYSKLTVTKLKKLCKEREVVLPKKILKKTLVELLEKDDEEREEKEKKKLVGEKRGREEGEGEEEETKAKKRKQEGQFENDVGVVLAAVQQDWEAMRFAGSVALDDKEVALAGVRQSGEAYDLVSRRLRGDRDVVLEYVSWSASNHLYAKYIPEELKKDKEVALVAVKANGCCLRHLDSFSGDKEVALVAVTSGGLKHVASSLAQDRDIFNKALKWEDYDTACDILHKKKVT
eukprot:TRINITY_DN3407_c0_g1_i3.p1 TRINITY_DN3407_c0_g1~~TRINITY_DN3407_c0_g1_i3.p1  ORF type:complete len:779 (+),score=244.32 TRINITY_DN3407_c0_g1_i3:60-2339(+)